MADTDLVPEPSFPPIPATDPIDSPAVPAEVFDQWFFDGVTINNQSQKVTLEAFWAQGNVTKLSGTKTNYIIRDLLSQESLAANPEIAQIAPQFLAALAAAGKRLGVL